MFFNCGLWSVCLCVCTCMQACAGLWCKSVFLTLSCSKKKKIANLFYNLAPGSLYNFLCCNPLVYSALTTLASLLFLSTPSTHYLRTFALYIYSCWNIDHPDILQLQFPLPTQIPSPHFLCHFQRPKGWFKKSDSRARDPKKMDAGQNPCIFSPYDPSLVYVYKILYFL